MAFGNHSIVELFGIDGQQKRKTNFECNLMDGSNIYDNNNNESRGTEVAKIYFLNKRTVLEECVTEEWQSGSVFSTMTIRAEICCPCLVAICHICEAAL